LVSTQKKTINNPTKERIQAREKNLKEEERNIKIIKQTSKRYFTLSAHQSSKKLQTTKMLKIPKHQTGFITKYDF